jgi:ABC-type transport system involved in multi-copper enzyme maturation permease subunit
MMTQTLAILIDAYRDLQARKLFWTVVILNILAMALFAMFGTNDHALTFLWYEPFGRFLKPVDYKILYSNVVVGVWFTWIATILALISTAGIFPDLLTSGSIDLYLAKPISRLRLFLTKYLAGLLFVALQVTVFALMSFLVLGLRGGLWEPGLFAAIPLVLVFFSYLFGICALLGVWTRSTVAALLLTLLAWGGIWAVDFVDKQSGRFIAMMNQQHEMLTREIDALDPQIAHAESLLASDGNGNDELAAQHDKLIAELKQRRERAVTSRDRMIVPDTLFTVQKVLYNVKSFVPKTRETLSLLDRVLFKDKDLQQASKPADDTATENPTPAPPPRFGPGRGPPGGMSGASITLVQAQIDRQRPIWWIVGTSLLFEAVCLALAAWHFCTRDF